MPEPAAPAITGSITGSLVLAADDPAAQPRRLALCLQRKADATSALAVLHAWIVTALELGASVDDSPCCCS